MSAKEEREEGLPDRRLGVLQCNVNVNVNVNVAIERTNVRVLFT